MNWVKDNIRIYRNAYQTHGSSFGRFTYAMIFLRVMIIFNLVKFASIAIFNVAYVCLVVANFVYSVLRPPADAMGFITWIFFALSFIGIGWTFLAAWYIGL